MAERHPLHRSWLRKKGHEVLHLVNHLDAVAAPLLRQLFRLKKADILNEGYIGFW